MTKNKIIYGDIGAIKTHGLQSYLDNYFWPISESEYQNIVTLMHKNYVHILDDIKDPFLYELGLVELTYISELQIIYHYQAVKKYASRNEHTLSFTENSRKYYELEWKEYANYYSRMKFPHGTMVRKIRRYVKNFIFNQHLGFYKFIKGFLFGKSVIGIGSFDRLKKEYVIKNNLFCDHYDWPDIIHYKPKDNKDVVKIVSKLNQELINPYLNLLINLDKQVFSKELIEDIRLAWNQRFKDLIGLFYNCTIFENKDLLLAESGKPHSKIISLVNNRNGAKVYNFHHGSDMGEVIQKRSHINDTSHSHYFVLPTNSSKKAYLSNYKCISVEKRSELSYISINSNFYKELYDNNQNKSLDNNIKSVMIIGYPMTQWRPMEEVGFFFYIRLEFEYRLITELKNKGFRVLYKAHPDRLQEISGLFEEIVDEFLIDPFEEVWSKADALIYGLTSTSTFGYGLCTNLPITLINLEGTSWNKNQKFFLEGRVSFVPAKLNKNQQIEFSLNNLFDTLRKPKLAKNWSEVGNYFN